MKKRKPIKIDPEAVYDAVAVAKTLGISRRQVTFMVQDKRLPDIKIGQKYMWSGKTVLDAVGTAPIDK